MIEFDDRSRCESLAVALLFAKGGFVKPSEVGDSRSSGEWCEPSSFCLFLRERKLKKPGPLAELGGSVPADRSPVSTGDMRGLSVGLRAEAKASFRLRLLLSMLAASAGTPDP